MPGSGVEVEISLGPRTLNHPTIVFPDPVTAQTFVPDALEKKYGPVLVNAQVLAVRFKVAVTDTHVPG
jgi:hypothetical protein